MRPCRLIRSLAWLGALTLVVVACSNENASGSEPGPAPPVTVSSTGQLLQWTEPDEYAYVLESRCGERALIGTFQIVVEEGEVQDVSALDEDAEAMLEHIGADPTPTIGDLVADVQAATRNGADRVSLEVNSDDGFPTSIEIDYDTNAIDDEVCYTITDVVVG
ncbi:MAG: DUF6174 domain-containing protein [Actinomycetota bacterium]